MTTLRATAGFLVVMAAVAGGSVSDARQKGVDEIKVPSITLTTGGTSTIKGHGEWNKGTLTYDRIDMYAAPVDGGLLWSAVGLASEPTGKQWPNTGDLLISPPNGTYNVWAVLTLKDGSNPNPVYYSSQVATVVVTGSIVQEPALAGNCLLWGSGEPVAFDGAITRKGTIVPPSGQKVSKVQFFATPAAGGKFSEGGGTTDLTASPKTWTGSVAGLANGTQYGVVGILTLESSAQYATKWEKRTPQAAP